MSQTYSLPKAYDPSTEEPKWQKWWEDHDVYRFDPSDQNRPTYSIDTPPPYPSGEFHVGNALNWCYFDFAARYYRMKGYNVHFPQGWDCNGLPTEVRAEKTFRIRKNDVPLSEFVEMCRKLTNEYIARMKKTITLLGVSIDWQLEYKTMDPAYCRLTQLSFLKLYKSGHMYRGEHPVNWCPRCETAIAEAEVDRQQRKGSLHYMTFGQESSSIEIASTRPELLAACVALAVHPDDPRYIHKAGSKVSVPIFGQEVMIFSDDQVDSSFGTGAVMVCTFGDKLDVVWQKRYQLPVVRAISENGRLTKAAHKYEGLSIENARKQILEDLKKDGRLVRTEPSQQNIGTCWRCGTPVEIISRPQWFMKTRNMTDMVIEWTEKLRWVPSFSKQRMIDWANSLDWDWVISRQRLFATPIPAWYCKKCGETIIATEDKLPVDPRNTASPEGSCPRCQSGELVGETDVFDTWMDSSITAAVHAGWPDNPHLFTRLFPADLQPNGLDIIRTWDYYLMVRSLSMFGRPPYKTLLINGMVRGTDGRMMHKSYGNTVETEEVLEKLGAEAFRQWVASGGSTGYDIPFRWPEAEHGRKFLNKLWNVGRFILSNLPQALPEFDPNSLALVDRWILSSTQRLIVNVSQALEEFQYNVAIEAIRDFTWHSLADDYLEAVKHRLQTKEMRPDKKAAQYCLFQALVTVCKLIAPFCPHISESLYQQIQSVDHERSIHSMPWPTRDPSLDSEDWMSEGRVLVDAIATGRRSKAERGVPLGAMISKVLIFASEKELQVLEQNQETLTRTLKAISLELREHSNKRSSSTSDTPKLRADIVV